MRLLDPLPSWTTPVRWDETVSTAFGTDVVLQGFGLTGLADHPDRNLPFNQAREGHAELEDCTNRFRSDGTLCALKAGQASLCKGDSGGPAFSNGVQIGVASFGSCQLGGSIWANVQRMRPWIRSVLSG